MVEETLPFDLLFALFRRRRFSEWLLGLPIGVFLRLPLNHLKRVPYSGLKGHLFSAAKHPKESLVFFPVTNLYSSVPPFVSRVSAGFSNHKNGICRSRSVKEK